MRNGNRSEQDYYTKNEAILTLCKAALGAGLMFVGPLTDAIGVLNMLIAFMITITLSITSTWLLGQAAMKGRLKHELHIGDEKTSNGEYSDLVDDRFKLVIDVFIAVQLIGSLLVYLNLASGIFGQHLSANKLVLDVLVMAIVYAMRSRVVESNVCGMVALLVACVCSITELKSDWRLRFPPDPQAIFQAIPSLLFATSCHLAIPMTMGRIEDATSWRRVSVSSQLVIFAIATCFALPHGNKVGGIGAAVLDVSIAINCIASFPVNLRQLRGIINVEKVDFVDYTIMMMLLLLNHIGGQSARQLFALVADLTGTPLILIIPALLHLCNRESFYHDHCCSTVIVAIINLVFAIIILMHKSIHY